MTSLNKTMTFYFILTGFSDDPQWQLPIFLLVLLCYFLILGGNLTIFVLVCLDHHLHTPMYFFLSNLAFLDMSFTSTTLHRILLNFITGHKTMSFRACASQIFVFASLTCDELLILTAMSYDRYVAICRPLQYSIIMGPKTCGYLASFCWVTGFVQMIPLIVKLGKVACFVSNIIDNFFCDAIQVVRLPCSNALYLELFIFVNGVFMGTFPFLFTCVPYVFIVYTALKIPSSKRRWKTFYTCSSHLTVVVLLYTSLICQYLKPLGGNVSSKFYSLLNTAAVPMLNPLIYSLKNKDVKDAMKRRWRLIL